MRDTSVESHSCAKKRARMGHPPGEWGPEGRTQSEKKTLAAILRVLTLRKARRVRQPGSCGRKGGLAPAISKIVVNAKSHAGHISGIQLLRKKRARMGHPQRAKLDAVGRGLYWRILGFMAE